MAEEQGSGLTGLGKVAVGAVVIGLMGVGLFFLRDTIFPEGTDPSTADIDLDAAQHALGPQTPEGAVEAMDLTGITTVSEYAYVPGERLPPVEGVSSYKWDEDNKIVEFPINMWIGWLPIVAANRGFSPSEESVFYEKYGFKVNLKLIDDPVIARDAYASGKSHVLWGTLDMMVLFAPGLAKDSRTALRIPQQIDWSNGGDGIVVRDGIGTVSDLRGKTIVYAQNSPSQYYVNALLINAGIQPGEVTHKYTASAFEAATAFVSDPSIDACASWAPDIYNIPEKVQGTKILSTTADANKLIADVWAVRADFAKDHPDIVAGLVEGIFLGMDEVKKDPSQAAIWMAEGFGMPVEEVNAMMADAHLTNFAENKQFFLNRNNPTNFERTWGATSFVYRELGLIDSPIRFDQVMDFSYVKTLEEQGRFKEQVDEYQTKFVPQSWTKVTAEAPILTQELRINFFPNSYTLHESARDEFGNLIEGKLYDPMVDTTVERAARLAGQFDAAVIAISGHTDASMQGKIPFEAVQELSDQRARAVKDELVQKYKFDENKFVVKGEGWNRPADAADPGNHYKNRRVEIAVYPPESGVISKAFRIREELPLWGRASLSTALVLLVLGAWFVVTWGATPESRIITPVILPSPGEVAASWESLWFDRALMRAVLASLMRVCMGFGAAVILAVPLGILMGAFTPIRAFFQPVAVVGGYLPIAALVPLTISWFGVDEGQKIFFLGMATFVLLPLVINAVDEVDSIYLKTAYTLGASPLVAVWKVLVPVSMPAIWDAMRLAFGIGWTYIILAEIVAAERGLGNLIIVSQRRGPREHIYLVLVVIVVLAFLTDKVLEWLGRKAFPHREVSR